MRTKPIIEGIELLLQYYNDPEGFHLGAEHERLYAFSTDSPLSQADVEMMVALGWFQDVPCGDEGFTAANYDPSESWTCHV